MAVRGLSPAGWPDVSQLPMSPVAAAADDELLIIESDSALTPSSRSASRSPEPASHPGAVLVAASLPSHPSLLAGAPLDADDGAHVSQSPAPEARVSPAAQPTQKLRRPEAEASHAQAAISSMDAALRSLERGARVEVQWRAGARGGGWAPAVVEENYGRLMQVKWAEGSLSVVELAKVALPGQGAAKQHAQRLVREQRAEERGPRPPKQQRTPRAPKPKRRRTEPRPKREPPPAPECPHVYPPPGSTVMVREKGIWWRAFVKHTPADSDVDGQYELWWGHNDPAGGRTGFYPQKCVRPVSGVLPETLLLPRFEVGDEVAVGGAEGVVGAAVRRGAEFEYRVVFGDEVRTVRSADVRLLRRPIRKKKDPPATFALPPDSPARRPSPPVTPRPAPTPSTPASAGRRRRRPVLDTQDPEPAPMRELAEEPSDEEPEPEPEPEPEREPEPDELQYVWVCRHEVSGGVRRPVGRRPEPPPPPPLRAQLPEPAPPEAPALSTTEALATSNRQWWWATTVVAMGPDGTRHYAGVRVGNVDYWVRCSARFDDGSGVSIGTVVDMWHSDFDAAVELVVQKFESDTQLSATGRRVQVHPSALREKVWILQPEADTGADPHAGCGAATAAAEPGTRNTFFSLIEQRGAAAV